MSRLSFFTLVLLLSGCGFPLIDTAPLQLVDFREKTQESHYPHYVTDDGIEIFLWADQETWYSGWYVVVQTAQDKERIADFCDYPTVEQEKNSPLWSLHWIDGPKGSAANLYNGCRAIEDNYYGTLSIHDFVDEGTETPVYVYDGMFVFLYGNGNWYAAVQEPTEPKLLRQKERRLETFCGYTSLRWDGEEGGESAILEYGCMPFRLAECMHSNVLSDNHSWYCEYGAYLPYWVTNMPMRGYVSLWWNHYEFVVYSIATSEAQRVQGQRWLEDALECPLNWHDSFEIGPHSRRAAISPACLAGKN